MQVVSIINQKGGVGKTTSVASIGAALAEAGHRVLLVDLDPQAHLSISFDRMPEPGDPSLYTLLTEGHKFEDVMQPTSVDGLWIAPTNLDLSGAETELANEIGREMLIRDALRRLGRAEDAPEVVLLDCPPSLGTLSLNALVGSDYVIVPLQAEFFALQGMAQLMDVLERVKRRLNPGIELLGVLVGLYSSQRNLSREVVEELRSHFGELLFPVHVRVNVRLAEAPSFGQTIFEYAPDSGAAEDFRAIAAMVAERLGLQAPAAAAGSEPAEEATPTESVDGDPRPAAAEAEERPAAAERAAAAEAPAPAPEQAAEVQEQHAE